MNDYEQITENITDFLDEKLQESGSEGFEVGVSGGIDSALTLKLAVRTAGSENVSALIMPGKSSKEENMEDARELADSLDVEYRKIDIEPAVKAVKAQESREIGEVSTGNIRARTRMIYEYLEANEQDKLVLGTGNRTEILLGYYTKYGDGAADLLPIADLYKTEVRELAEHLGIDKKFIEKAPTAGLWEGQTDEDELGATYEIMDEILKHLVDENLSVPEVAEQLDIDPDEVERFQMMHQKTEHKRKMPESPDLKH